jgi:hypothetical protein
MNTAKTETETESPGGGNKPVLYRHGHQSYQSWAGTHTQAHAIQDKTHTSLFLSSSRVTKMTDWMSEHVVDGMAFVALHFFFIIT